MKSLLLSFTLLFISSIQVSHARLTSLSAVTTVNVDGQSLQQVVVSCGTKNQRPILLRKKGGRQWCDSQITNICHQNKVEVGERVCSLSYSHRLKSLVGTESKRKKSGEVAELLKEARDIEDALLEIQASRIALRKRKLELIKQRDREILQASR